ncbi:uncharacterized protein RAG0_15971 [Rhynchosporium agropyri]|uniref:Ribonuclease H1 N-terminal domain-containing protein n=1 Tax=Rhynchosporium agropyri TaxID=914238 RepID=A0A1E1LN95_9HELO|nr:uncharacterized protein RAG0_15971 [Rhynchosporium agropyri]
MAKYKRKNYYAIAEGRIAPAICASWGVTNALVSGYSNNKQKGFSTYKEAASYLEERGHANCRFFRGSAEGQRAPTKVEPLWYAVANGKQVGVYEYYQGGAERGITKHAHSCHKGFKSREEAEDFIEEYRITANLVDGVSVDEGAASDLGHLLAQLELGQNNGVTD